MMIGRPGRVHILSHGGKCLAAWLTSQCGMQRLAADKAGAGKRPAAQPFVSKVDRTDSAVAARAVDLDR